MEKNVRRVARLVMGIVALVLAASTARAQTDGGADGAADATVDAAPVVPDGARPDYEELEDGGGRGWVCAAGPSRGAGLDAGAVIAACALALVTSRRVGRALNVTR